MFIASKTVKTELYRLFYKRHTLPGCATSEKSEKKTCRLALVSLPGNHIGPLFDHVDNVATIDQPSLQVMVFVKTAHTKQKSFSNKKGSCGEISPDTGPTISHVRHGRSGGSSEVQHTSSRNPKQQPRGQIQQLF